jgi:hypothetical protein
MAKKWVIDDGPPLRMRLIQEIERSQDAEPIDKPNRVRTICKHIVKVLVALWMLSVGAWLQANHGDKTIASTDGPHDAIDEHGDPFNAI